MIFTCKEKIAIPGYLPGMSQPSLIAVIHNNVHAKHSDSIAKKLDHAYTKVLGDFSTDSIPADFQTIPALYRMIAGVSTILTRAGFPVCTHATVLEKKDGQLITVALPSIQDAYQATSLTLDWSLGFANDVSAQRPLQHWMNTLPDLIKRISALGPKGQNPLLFMKAAHKAGIPWNRVIENIFQFGWGARARWLDSTFTDNTSRLSAKIARDKSHTAFVLRNASIPVPRHFLVTNETQALEAAGELGYPVVVKPSDLDGGQGVYAGLKTPDSLRKAFSNTSKISANVLVEKHFEGNDYRLQVFREEVFWATHRIAGSITGDGQRTISELLATLNATRGKPEIGLFLKPIPLDEEALDLLAEQGLTDHDVPAKDRAVWLRRRSNVSSGGTFEPVLDKVHPDNKALAIRAARVLKLDLAGVDLLIPDISRSWLETGAVICEVNAQPQVASAAIDRLLQKLIRGNGRIPVIVILGCIAGESWFQEALASLQSAGLSPGVVFDKTVTIHNQTVTNSVNFFQGTRILLGDSAVDAAIIVISDYRQGFGLPVDRIDGLILSGSIHSDATPASDITSAIQDQAIQMVRLFSRCTENILIHETSHEWIELGKQLADKSIQYINNIQLSKKFGLAEQEIWSQ